MASIPNNIVAKDSGGNIKKIDLTSLLAEYVKIEDVQNISGNVPECLKSVSLSLSNATSNKNEFESPFLISGVSLSISPYGNDPVISSIPFSLEARELINSADAYRFVIESAATPFNVDSTKQCFLVLSLDGHEKIGSEAVYGKNDCKAIGAYGGNPIILDWNDVILGGSYSTQFAYKDPDQPVGVFGTFELIRRTAYLGNIHTYAFRLEFVVCGSDAWKNLREGSKLTLEAQNVSNESASSSVNLNSIIYPKISRIGIFKEDELFLSSGIPSKISFKPEKGILVQIGNADEDNFSLDEKVVAIGMHPEEIAGSGLIVDLEGRLEAPLFKPADGSSDAVAGLVPSIEAGMAGCILTASGWKEPSEIGLEPLTNSFAGATENADGSGGFVPKPLIEDRFLFLSGDGTWRGSLANVSGELNCSFSSVKRNHVAGFGICDMNGNWVLSNGRIEARIAPDESEEGFINLDMPLEDVYGIFICSPYSSKIPSILEENENRWTADKTIWSQTKTEVFRATFADGSLVEISLSSSDEGMAVLEYKMYGCQALSERCILLSIDGNEAIYSCLLKANDSIDFEISGSIIKVWPLQSKSCMLYDSSLSEEEDENQWIELSDEPSLLSVLGLEISRTSDGIHVHALDVDLSAWPTEIDDIRIVLNDGESSKSIAMPCLANWANSRLTYHENWLLEIDGKLSEYLVPFKGATEFENGHSGLVPSASSEERNFFLRGDGTWANASISGSCLCGYEHVKRQYNLGVNICDGDGSWLSSAIKISPSMRPDEVLTYTLNLRFGADGPGGCSLCSPYNAAAPASAEDRTYEFYRDSTIWVRGTSNHFIQTFSDGITMDCWIEVDETKSGYHNLMVAVYGPKAGNVPRLVSLNIDGTNMFLVQNLSAGDSFEIPVAGTDIKIYPRPTFKTVLWRNEFNEWSGTTVEPVLLSDVPGEFPYLSYTAERTSTGVKITADDYNLSDWPVELSSSVLKISAGGEQTSIDLGCISSWMSSELLKIDEALDATNSKIDAIGVYQGATENESGVAGLVPPALKTDAGKFLMADGTWSDPLSNASIDDYIGATSSSDGIHGLVPSAPSASKDKFLKGDGTWSEAYVVTDSLPTESDAGGLFFYIEN